MYHHQLLIILVLGASAFQTLGSSHMQLVGASQLPQVVPVMPILREGDQGSGTTGNFAKSHGLCEARPNLNTDVSVTCVAFH